MKSGAPGLFLACALLPSAQAADSHGEIWPELQAYWRLSPATQLMFNLAPARSRESGDRASSDKALYLDYRRDDRVSYRFGYLYSVTTPQSPEKPKGKEHRLSADYSYRWKIGQAGLLTDRTRLDLRDRQDGFSQRLRNRLQYEQETKFGDRTVIPYANVELFYDTRYDAIARVRYEAGATLVFAPQADLTLYLGRQTETRPERQNADALGVIFGFHF